MKRFFVLALIFSTLAFVPLSVRAERATDGKGKERKHKVTKVSKRELIRRIAMVRKAEAARRAAAAAAYRRQVAFESGLKTEAVTNISKDNIAVQDPKIREAAVAALGNNVGTVVVMDAQTGRIEAMVNSDMAVREPIKPCSTIKLVTGIAGLQAGALDADGKIIGSRSSKTLATALAKSDNSFFELLGRKVGPETFRATALKLGLGSPTGINLPSESPGKLPSGKFGSGAYWKGDGVEVTAIQLARMVSTIANGGKKVKPYFPTSVDSKNESVAEQVDLPIQSFQGMIPGMRGSATDGTARVLGETNPDLDAAAKTGTCKDRSNSVHTGIGLNASVAPIGNPKYAVVVITHGKGQKGRVASRIASEVYKTLLPPKPKILEKDAKTVAVKESTK